MSDNKGIGEEERWIEADGLETGDNEKDEASNDDVGGQPDVGDMFADPDPYEEFEFSFPNNIHIVLSGIKAENGQTLNSTGLTLWRASPQLCNFMVTQADSILSKNVLELGAGLGLCGILAHFLKAKTVVLTDGDTDTLAAMRANVATNVSGHHEDDHTVTCRQLRWGRNVNTFLSSYPEGFDVILASDVIYLEQVVEPLLDTVMKLLSSNGQFWLSYARRNVSIDLVLDSARRYGLEWKETCDAEGVFVFSMKQSG